MSKLVDFLIFIVVAVLAIAVTMILPAISWWVLGLFGVQLSFWKVLIAWYITDLIMLGVKVAFMPKGADKNQ